MTGDEICKVLYEEHIGRNGKNLAWTIPIAFPVAEDHAKSYKVGKELAVIASSGECVVYLLIEKTYPIEKRRYLKSVYGTERLTTLE